MLTVHYHIVQRIEFARYLRHDRGYLAKAMGPGRRVLPESETGYSGRRELERGYTWWFIARRCLLRLTRRD
ncbi:hypothetical protein [Thermanaeromonas toyohensis]|uniref:hypothetical protein n=1 Tax=Thermanaeromonas toyohensis TaxID=161154 RepID=UPI0012F4B81C|nr:hypothetical protein [Thermanaeromonas toyohensis]